MPDGLPLGILNGYSQGYDQSLEQMANMAVGRTLQAISQQQQSPMGGMPSQMPPPSMGGGNQNPIGSQPVGASPQGPIPQPSPIQSMGGPPNGPQPTPQGVGGQIASNPAASFGGPPNFANRFPQVSPGPQPGIGAFAGQASAPPMAQPPALPPQQPPQPPQPVGYGQQPQGQLDWRQIIQQVTRANPGIPPQVLAGAVNKFIPLMNSQSQMEWKQVQQQINYDRMLNQQQGIEAKYAQINTQRETQGLPPLGYKQFLQSFGGDQGQGQPQGGQQQPGQQQQGADLLAGLDQNKLQRATQLGWDKNAILQAATVYQQTGKPPTGLGTRASASFIQGLIKDVAENINKQQGITDKEMTANWQTYHAEGKFQDTSASYGARVENAVNELKQLIPQAEAASNEYNRSDILALNTLYNKWKSGQSDPKFNDLLIASFGTISAYVRAMNPAGTPRVADRLETEAINLLSTAVGKEAYLTQLRRMWKEAQASQTATYETGKEGRRPGDINAPMPGDTAQPNQPQQIPDGWSVQEH